MELIAFDGAQLQRIWSEAKKITRIVRIGSDIIVLESQEVDKNGRNAREVARTYKIEKRGLTEIK
jgi:hypothetical protein